VGNLNASVGATQNHDRFLSRAHCGSVQILVVKLDRNLLTKSSGCVNYGRDDSSLRAMEEKGLTKVRSRKEKEGFSNRGGQKKKEGSSGSFQLDPIVRWLVTNQYRTILPCIIDVLELFRNSHVAPQKPHQIYTGIPLCSTCKTPGPASTQEMDTIGCSYGRTTLRFGPAVYLRAESDASRCLGLRLSCNPGRTAEQI
jgi:hypothetical protein